MKNDDQKICTRGPRGGGVVDGVVVEIDGSRKVKYDDVRNDAR